VGVIAFVLNFIPFIGSFVATLLPAVFAAAQFESLYAALVVFICLNLLQFIIGSYIEPRVAGTAVSVSPFMVLFAVFFWGVLWGVAGAFIGVPILIALAVVCAQYPATRSISALLSADTTTRSASR
jgi:AI-2 transport protein TqsA